MPKTEKELLAAVIEVAGDNEKMIEAGIKKALQGTSDRARRTYLWNTLARQAKKKISSARKNAEKKSASA